MKKNTSAERDDSWLNYRFKNFKGIFLNGWSYKVDSAICFDVISHLKHNKYDHIVCTDFALPTGMMAITYMRSKKIGYYLESDGGFPKNNNGLKEKVKKHYIKGAKGYFSTGTMHDSYYIHYGANPEKIYRYPFTSLKNEDILTDVPTYEEKVKLRKELSMTEKGIVLYVGRIIHGKGIDTLISAAKELPADTGVYLVGGEPTEYYTQQIEKQGVTNIHFVGFTLKEELKKYYKAADVFVLPTKKDVWGLVINEAMSMGLPVVTTDKCIAGLELVENGKNGYIVPVDDVNVLSQRIKEILTDEQITGIGKSSLEKIRNYTIEEMAHVHFKIFKEFYADE